MNQIETGTSFRLQSSEFYELEISHRLVGPVVEADHAHAEGDVLSLSLRCFKIEPQT